ncbi:MAG: hypothetical protein N4A36_03775, partial [Candidatus Gracilibacteria bacterium]|nr:hypothetical protein [Candidatus Gracilibacteria bacterium]
MKKLTQKLKAKKGLIIVEVILSLFVFSLGLGGATMLVFSAIDVNARNENRIISINLAREGIEAIRNMRDTNWMTWSANRRECWNFWDNTNEDTSLNSFDDACTVSGGINNHPIGRKADGTKIKDFIVNFDKANYRWILIPKTNTYGMT